MDKPSSSGDSGAERGDRPFPRAVPDRPAESRPRLSWDDYKVMGEKLKAELEQKQARAAEEREAALKDLHLPPGLTPRELYWEQLKAQGKKLKAQQEGEGSQPPGEGQKEHKPGDKGVITHFHGDNLDLYTDGTRWVSGEAVRAAQRKQEHKPEAPGPGISDVPGVRDLGSDVIGERPDDEADLPPEREELMEADNDKLSRMDRLRRKHGDQEYVENLHDNTQEQFNEMQKVIESWHPQGHPVQTTPGPVYEPVPVQNHAAMGDVVSAALMTSIMVTEGARRIHDMLAPNREAER